jgi:protein CpxP
MSYFTKNKTSYLVLIVLLVANLAATTFFWTSKNEGAKKPDKEQQKDHPMHQRGGGIDKFLTEELGLTVEQQQQLKDLRQEHMHNSRKIMDASHENRKQLHDMISNATVDDSLVVQLYTEIGANFGEMERVTFEHFRAMRNICTPEQQEKFDQIISKALRKNRPLGPPPGGPRGPGHGGPPPGGGPLNH